MHQTRRDHPAGHDHRLGQPVIHSGPADGWVPCTVCRLPAHVLQSRRPHAATVSGRVDGSFLPVCRNATLGMGLAEMWLLQLVPDAVQSVQDQAGVFKVTLPGFFWSEYSAARNSCISTGNLMLFALGAVTGGINLGGNTVRMPCAIIRLLPGAAQIVNCPDLGRRAQGVRLANISVHSAALTFGLGELGHVSIEGLGGVRRPGTNRLGAGGWVALTLHGGSLHMSDSELSYNLDDLTDIQSGLAYASNQVSRCQPVTTGGPASLDMGPSSKDAPGRCRRPPPACMSAASNLCQWAPPFDSTTWRRSHVMELPTSQPPSQWMTRRSLQTSRTA